MNLKTKTMIELPKELQEGLFIESVNLDFITGENDSEQTLTLVIHNDNHISVNFNIQLSGINGLFDIEEEHCSIGVFEFHENDKISELQEGILTEYLSVLISAHSKELEMFANEYFEALIDSHLIKLHSFEAEFQNDFESLDPIVYSIMSCYEIKARGIVTEVIAASKDEALAIYLDIQNNTNLASKNRYLPELEESEYTCEYSHDVIVCNNPDYNATELSKQKYDSIKPI